MKSLTRIVLGILIIITGCLFLLSNIGVQPFGATIGDWWPLLIIAAGIIMLVNDPKNYLWALVVIGLGAAFQLTQLSIVAISPWQLFWPAVIMIVGIAIITGHSSAKKRVTAETSEEVTAILSGTEQQNSSDDFRASKVTAVLGGVTLDLRKATIKDEASLEVFALWGGVELFVPETVEVKCTTSNIMGGIEDKTRKPATKNAPILYISGDVIMAGIEIKN